AVEQAEGLQELDGFLLQAGPHVTDRPPHEDGAEFVVVEASSRRPDVVSDTRRARGRARGAEFPRVVGGGDPRLGGEILERGVEEDLPPRARAFLAYRRELGARLADGGGVQRERAAPDLDAAEEEPVAGERGVEPAGALGERRESVIPGGEPDAG